jgi:hypothetical protein
VNGQQMYMTPPVLPDCSRFDVICKHCQRGV